MFHTKLQWLRLTKPHILVLRAYSQKIADHISLIYGAHYGAMEWEACDGSGWRSRHIERIRELLDEEPH
jgi:hypothetical protein